MNLSTNYKTWMLSSIYYPLTQVILLSMPFLLEFYELQDFSIPVLGNLGRILIILIFVLLVSRLLYLKQPLWLVGLVVILGWIMSFADHSFALLWQLTQSNKFMTTYLFYGEAVLSTLAFAIIIWSFFMREKRN